MSQIEVPDWVVEIAAKAYFEDMCPLDRWNDPMDEEERDEWRDGARKVITAALGAWVVPVYAAVEYSNDFTTYCHFYDRANAQAFLDHNDSDASLDTLYTLRQDKP